MSNFVLTPNAVAKLRRAIAPRSGNTGAVAATGLPIDPDKFPPPFTVRWSASAASGAGAWVIWLPDVAQLVMLKDEYITPTGVTAEQALPGGWYTIDGAAASSTEVYLNITIPETGTASAEISTTQGQSTTGETVMSILVAEMDADAETGAKRVKQYVDSAALVGSVKDGESGADAGIYITQVPIDPSTTPDHPGGGVEITFQPTQDGVPVGQPTVVTLWNGSGGGGGGTDLSNTPALDVVAADGSAAGQASAGVAVTASRQDHVHKMPATVVLTDADQTINSIKSFAASVGAIRLLLGGDGGGYFQIVNFASDNVFRFQYRASSSSSGYSFFAADPSGQSITLGNVVAFPNVLLAINPSATPSQATGTTGRQVATLYWVNANYQQKLTAGSNITIHDNTISAVIPESLPNPKSLRVYGNPTSNAGTAIASPNPTTYNGSAQTDIHLDGLVTKGTDQFINSVKVIGPKNGNTYSHLRFQHNSNDSQTRLQYGQYSGLDTFQLWKYTGEGTGNIGNLLVAQGTFLELGARGTGTGAIDDVRLGSGADAALYEVAPTTSGTDARRIVDIKWVTNKFQQKLIAGSNITISGNTISAIQPTVNNGTLTIKQGTTTLGTFTANQSSNTTVTIPTPPTPPTVNNGTLTIKQGTTTLGTFTANQANGTTVTIPEPPTPPSGTVEFVADIDWYVNGSTHQIRKRLRVLNLATGAITDKAGTTYANGWEVAANTTPISSIIPPSS